ncbi:MAG: PQQ-dependent sugar dehydrogenase, partial [Flavobacterium sp.]
MTRKILFSGFFLAVTAVCFVSCNQQDASSTSKSSAKEVFLSSDGSFTLDTLAKGLLLPFGMDWLPDGKMIFTERGRKDSAISIMDSTGKITRLCNVPVADLQGQGGMLDVLVHPDYKNNGWVYFSYAHRKEDTLTTLIVERAKIENNCLTSIQRIFEGFPYHNSNNHYGSRMLIKDSFLYLTMGERANAPDS